jgi:hypothetical protein
MDFLLFAIALGFLLLAGYGAASLLTRCRQTPGLELLSLSVLCGAAVISLLSFGLGFFVSGRPLRWMVAVVAVVLAVVAIARRERAKTDRLIDRKWDWLMIGVLLIQCLLIAWVSVRLALGYDGLILWETKARLLFLNGGVMPLDYYRDSTKFFGTNYPLLLPLTEVWFYGWIGRQHQGLIKLVSPLFYLAGVGLLYVHAARLSGRRWCGFLSAALFFFTPCVALRVSAGEADFPLGVFYLAAVVYLLEYWRTNDSVALRLVAALVAVLPWVKQDGSILMLCLIGLAAIKAVTRRDWKAIGIVTAPGVLVWGGWELFLKFVHVSTATVFLPVTPHTLWSNLDRSPVIAQYVMREMTNWQSWSLLWFIPILLLLRLKDKELRSLTAISLITIYLPISLYAGIYIFSAWTPFTLHIEASLSRLMLQLSLAAALMIGLAIPNHSRQVASEQKREDDEVKILSQV